MAYSNLTCTDINDALNDFHAFAVTNGWTANDLSDDSSIYSGTAGTGRRSHLQKTGGAKSLTAYVNMRSVPNPAKVFDYNSTYYPSIQGIAISLSTGYNVSNDWDYQPGYSEDPYNNSGNESYGTASGIYYDASDHETMATSSIDCHFFASNSGNTIIGAFEAESSSEQYLLIAFGFTTTGDYFMAASGAGRCAVNGVIDAHSFLCHYSASASRVGHVCDGTNQYIIGRNNTYINEQPLTLRRPVSGYTRTTIVDELLYRGGADTQLGNPLLVPSWLFSGTTAAFAYTIGSVPGMKYVNMTNQTHKADIVIGSDTYKLFRVSTIEAEDVFGVALLK